MRLCTPTEFSIQSYAASYDVKTIPYSRTMNYLCEITAQQFGVSPNDLKRKSRQRIFTDPRSIVCHFAYYELKISLVKIGQYFGQDHTTIIHAREKCNNLVHTDKSFLRKFLFVKSKMV